MRIGIFGGSFDPVHYGHLLLAEYCRAQCDLDEVWFVPAAVAPHKLDGETASNAHRVQMLELATASNPAFRVSQIELERGGVSYTVDTLKAIHDDQPEAELFLLIGGDSLNDLPTWREPKAICELAWPTAVGRVGSPPVDYQSLATVMKKDRLEQARQYAVAMPLVELSSSEIRRRTQSGESIRYQTPDAVSEYIQSERLYRD